MKNTNYSIAHEIINTSQKTNVNFYISTDLGSYVPNHWHRAIEIIYVLEGNLDVTIESQTTTLAADDCILINTNIIHSTKCTTPNTAIVLQIPIEFISIYLPNVQQFYFVLDSNKKSKIELIKNILSQMQFIYSSHPDGFLLKFNSLLFELLFQLYHHCRVKIFYTNFDKKTKYLERLDTILNYIAENYNRPISLTEISSIAFLQPRYFCRFFKKYMGSTFLEYQNELRLSYIYRDLITTSDPIHNILERHGFTNYKLFRKIFYEHFHHTPSSLRKSLRQDEHSSL